MSVISLAEQTLRISVPYLFAAAGGVVAERSGVVSLTLEGFMLMGAFATVVGSFYSHSPYVGILTGVVVGLAFGLIHAALSLRFRANQIVVGIGINLLAIGLTRLFLKLIFDSSSNSARVAGFGTEGGGSLSMFDNPLLWLGVLVIPAVAFSIDKTRFGLRLRAVGEHPKAAESLGIDVRYVRTIAVGLSGVLAALGGAYLALDQHQFSDEMTGGRGFIALAAIITGSWRPLRAGLACVLFAAAETLQIQLQTLQVLPSQLLSTIPYVVTLLVLVGWVGRSTPPAALGKPFGEPGT